MSRSVQPSKLPERHSNREIRVSRPLIYWSSIICIYLQIDSGDKFNMHATEGSRPGSRREFRQCPRFLALLNQRPTFSRQTDTELVMKCIRLKKRSDISGLRASAALLLGQRNALTRGGSARW